MKVFAIKEYIDNAIYIIKTTTIVLWFLVLVGIISSITSLFPESPLYWPLTFSTSLLSVIAIPVIYGIYYELIEDRYSSMLEIATKYIGRYVWLLFSMYIPVVLLATLPQVMMPQLGSGGSFQLTIVSFSLLYLYVIPWFYVSDKTRGAITEGIYFLIKNLSASTPLLLLTLLAESVMLIFQYNKKWITDINTPLFVVADIAIYVIASVIDYIVFIVLIFILKAAKEAHGGSPGAEKKNGM